MRAEGGQIEKKEWQRQKTYRVASPPLTPPSIEHIMSREASPSFIYAIWSTLYALAFVFRHRFPQAFVIGVTKTWHETELLMLCSTHFLQRIARTYIYTRQTHTPKQPSNFRDKKTLYSMSRKAATNIRQSLNIYSIVTRRDYWDRIWRDRILYI
jgi:hypothetical protein